MKRGLTLAAVLVPVFGPLLVASACGGGDVVELGTPVDAAVKTYDGSAAAVDGGPVADGGCVSTGAVTGTIYYSRAKGDDGDGRIYSINGDGTGETFVTIGNIPRLAPSGRYMAFHRGSTSRDFAFGGALWLKDFTLPPTSGDAGVGNEAQLFASGDYLVAYSFTTDESQVVFDYFCALSIVGRDGANPHQLASYLGCYTDAPATRGDDGLIAFHNEQIGLGTLTADGVSGAQIANTATGDHWPVWTSDGQSIVFQRRSASGSSVAIFRIRPDGSQLTMLGTLDSPSIGAMGRVGEREVYVTYGGRGGFTAFYAFDVQDATAEPVRICLPAGDPISAVDVMHVSADAVLF